MYTSLDGTLELLVLQGSPFCNLNCSYCYLPNRQSQDRMSKEVMRGVLTNVLSSRLRSDRLTIVWHAGEPLALPLAYYEEAFALVREVNQEITGGRVEITHSVQTNATTLNAAWCEFLKAHDVRVGVSIDGPADLHDAQRVSWTGKGSHARAMRGVRLLQEHSIGFHVISVVTRATMQRPEDLFRFYVDAGFKSVGFNVEEQEGIHTASPIHGEAVRAEYRAFLETFMRLNEAAADPIHVREFQSIAGAIRFGDESLRAQDNQAFRILSVDWQGNFSTWSPELLGLEHEAYGDFVLGNLGTAPLDSVLETDKFRWLHEEIEAGIAACRRECEYFNLCGGGCPSNKLAERGSFQATETAHCGLVKKTLAEVALADLENLLALA